MILTFNLIEAFQRTSEFDMKFWILLFYLDFTFGHPQALDLCPSGSNPNRYKTILGHCYYFEGTSMNFEAAEANCKSSFGSQVKYITESLSL